MLADPQTVTINAVAQTLPAIVRSTNSSAYQKDDANVKLGISHTYGGRTRRVARLDFKKIAADPLISAQSILYSMSSYLVIDTPITGFTVAEAKQIVDALVAWLSASSGANITKILGGES